MRWGADRRAGSGARMASGATPTASAAADGASDQAAAGPSGQYGGSRNFYMVTRGAPKGAAREWIKWITHSAAAATIVGTDWVPLH